jgi:hypothetical protein
MNPLIQFKTTTLLPVIAFTFACFGPLPIALALLPPPDGGYPHGTTAEGDGALGSLTLSGKGPTPAAVNNTALGFDTLFYNTFGHDNTATGYQALFHNDANANTADGFEALYSNTFGHFNTAIGSQALYHNRGGADDLDLGADNTAVGYQSLYSNTFGFENTAVGYQALFSNVGGRSGPRPFGVANTALGYQALQNNISGAYNTALGDQALFHNTVDGNTAVGQGALFQNTTGFENVALGAGALAQMTTGNFNVALGSQAGGSLETGDNNIYIGSLAGAFSESATIRIGDAQTSTFIAGIYGNEFLGSNVVVKSDGQLGVGVIISSARFKDEIKPMDKASEAILALKPVTFRYKKEVDPKGIPQFGLVAEEVENVNPALITRDRHGKPYTVRYEAVNAMLLNEFLKEHQKVQKLEAALKTVNERLKEQDAKIDKVNAKVELTKPAPEVANNGQ